VDLVASAVSEECHNNKNRNLKINKSIQLNIINCLKLIKKQLHNKLEKLLERKHLNNILIKVAIQINLRKLQMLIKFYLIQKKDNSMMIMDKKVYKMEDLLEDLASEDCFKCLVEEGNKIQVQEKENQDLLNYKLLFQKFTMAV